MKFKVDKKAWQSDRRTKQYPRQLPKDKEEWLLQWINAALEAGLISHAPAGLVPNWSQVVLVLKNGGKDYRFCVDYTELNQFMESAGWLIPHILCDIA